MVLSLCAAVILGFSAYLVNIARVADIEQAIAEEKAAYERRVYRTTVKNRDLVTKYAQEYGLRPAYIAAIILNESSYDPQAVSSVGARGMMQLMPDTGKWIAGRIGIKADDYHDDLLFDPDVNIHMGAWYLNYLSGLYQGDPVLVACAYHAGHGNVDAWLQRYSQDGRTLTIEEIPKSDTRAYAKKVVDSYAIYLENYYQD
ncbi:MAG: lytic transglycosylase domain-containing protein [Clostridia bacterium]|nr:lytic transglycosylase domain-containing protein [Clostridia bacterium]